MELRVLGPFDAHEGGTPISLGTPRERALLARLAIDANRAVSTTQLIDDLWGEAVPDSAVKMIQVYVSHLRKVLPPQALQTTPPGYAIRLDPEAIDLTRFMRLRSEGHEALTANDPLTASMRFRGALDLWRGPALAEFSEPFARVEGSHLDELRLECVEHRIRSDLALGRHADVVAELELLVASHRLRETLHSNLMLALYRCGRQAEALSAYDRFRRALDDELGLEPSRALKALQLRILNQDESLDVAGGSVRIAGPEPESPPAPSSSGDIVGRDSELVRLEEAFEAAAAGDGNALLISGPAGIGKTRLRAELTERARSRGAHVLDGRCIQLVGSGLPYLPVVDALRPLRGSRAAQELAEELHELPRLLPELTTRGGDERPEPVDTDSRVRLFEEVLALLERLGEDAPVVLVLEDLHWADVSTLDLVSFLAHAVSSKRILLVLTSRTEAVEAGNQLHALTVASAVTPIQLEPLTDSAIEALLSGRSEESPSVDLLRGITRRAHGNPFFARELLAAARRGEGSLPPRLRDVLLATVARLDPETRSILRVVAATGRPVSYQLLAAVTSIAEGELAEAVRQAAENEVLVPNYEARTYGFRHELYAEAVYGTLLPGERELLHARLAQALSDDRLPGARGAAAEQAHHWVAAGRPVEALGASLQAAREAEAVSGLTEALGHVERVLELWDEVPRAEQLAGVGLSSVLAWAVDLAGASAHPDDQVDTGVMLAALAPGEELQPHALATRLGVGADAALAALESLEREGLVERVGNAVRPTPLAVTEASRLFPAAVVLESLAIRQAPPFADSLIAKLRAANDRLRAVRSDPAAAATADEDFHRLLTADCGNPHLLAALAPIKRALLRYERVYMLEAARVDRSVAGHEVIIAALARGDRAEAAQRVRGNLTYGLDELRDVLDG